MNKIVIGLTGPSGSGKGYIAKLFSEYGIPSLDTDQTVHELYLPGTPCTTELLASFGQDILSEDGSVDRKKLTSVVFADREKLDLLNHIVHKYVRFAFYEWLNDLPDHIRAVLIDAPQLFESGMDQDCEYVIGVLAEDEVRLERVIQRDHISKELAKKRFANALPNSYFEEHCDFIILNNPGDLPKMQVQDIINQIIV